MRKILAIALIAVGIVLIAASAIELVSFNSILLYVGIVAGAVLLAAGIFFYIKSGTMANAPSQPPSPPEQPTPESNPETPS